MIQSVIFLLVPKHSYKNKKMNSKTRGKNFSLGQIRNGKFSKFLVPLLLLTFIPSQTPIAFSQESDVNESKSYVPVVPVNQAAKLTFANTQVVKPALVYQPLNESPLSLPTKSVESVEVKQAHSTLVSSGGMYVPG